MKLLAAQVFMTDAAFWGRNGIKKKVRLAQGGPSARIGLL